MKRIVAVSRQLLTLESCAAVSSISPKLPGRLSDPAATVNKDERMDPAIARVMAKQPPGAAEDLTGKSVEEQAAICVKLETAMEKLFNAKGAQPRPEIEAQVEYTDLTCPSLDGGPEVMLQMVRPKGSTGQVLPCLYHMHGGGMALGSTFDAGFRNHRACLAAKGICVVGVEFRNSPGGKVYGPNAPRAPFPHGINDCMAGLTHLCENKTKYNISTVVLNGESGGGNLCCGLALLAKRQNKLHMVDGVYANCPYVCGPGRFGDLPSDLVSMWENGGSDGPDGMLDMMLDLYTPPGSKEREDYVAWPLKATEEELKGLPPHVISVNELDPLRDEGLEYYRKLRRAGVTARGVVVVGTNHAGDVGGTSALAKFAMEGTRDAIVQFTKSPKPEF